jgi:hypothetical protein
MRGSSLRRMTRALLISLLATVGLFVVTPPAMACACGGVVNQPGRSTTVTGETALISQHAGRETMVMALDARSDAARAGLLVPTPAPATPALADRNVFTDLDRQTAPRPKVRHHFFGPPAIFDGDGDRSAGNGAGSRASGGVRVLGKVDLGPLQAVSLTATDAGDLHSWLDERGFVMSSGFESLVTPYLDQGWAFTAMTLTADGRSLNGDLPPISLDFASDRLVYPMRMSRGAKETQRVTTYVLAGHRVRRTDPTAVQGQLRTVYAARVRPALVTSADLKALTTDRPWLTEITQTLNEPTTQVRSDFTFAAAAHDTPVVSYDYTDEYFLPIDVAILLVLVVGGLATGVVLLVRRQRKS